MIPQFNSVINIIIMRYVCSAACGFNESPGTATMHISHNHLHGGAIEIVRRQFVAPQQKILRIHDGNNNNVL